MSEDSAALREENARLKGLVDGGRDRVWIDDELRVSHEGPLPPASPQTGHGQVGVRLMRL